MLTMGEVHTGLLQSSTPLSLDRAVRTRLQNAPASAVETIIALSILFLAAELARVMAQVPPESARRSSPQ